MYVFESDMGFVDGMVGMGSIRYFVLGLLWWYGYLISFDVLYWYVVRCDVVVFSIFVLYFAWSLIVFGF